MKKNIVLCGAGKIGKKNYEFLKTHGMEKIILAWCDKNYKNIDDIDGIPIQSYESVKNTNCIYIISVVNGMSELVRMLENDKKRYYASLSSWIYDSFTGNRRRFTY